MRAKISFKTELLIEDIQVRFREHHWWPPFSQDSLEAEDIKQRILDTVAPPHLRMATEGAKFVIQNTKTETEGLVSEEQGSMVVRIKNGDSIILREECEEIVEFISKYCKLNSRALEFPEKIEILEIRSGHRIIEGQVISSPKERQKLARKRKRLEFLVAIFGFVLLVFLLLITFPWPDLDLLKQSNKVVFWLFDLPSKAIGSVLITTLSSYLSYRFFLYSLRDDLVLWGLPERDKVL